MKYEQEYVTRITAQMGELGIPRSTAIEFLDEERSLGARGVVQRFLRIPSLLELELKELSEKNISGNEAVLELSKAMKTYDLYKLESLGMAFYGTN